MSEHILTHKHQTHNHAASGWRIHCGVEVTELSTNKQHTLSSGEVGACGRQVMRECAQENERDACAREGANVRAHTRQRIHGHTDAQKLNSGTQTHAHRWETTLARPSSGEDFFARARVGLRTECLARSPVSLAQTRFRVFGYVGARGATLSINGPLSLFARFIQTNRCGLPPRRLAVCL